MKQLLMGNEAVAFGAMAAGVGVVSGYPGTPSTEVLETIAKHNPGQIHVEWSINEKAGLEVAAGAAYAGARSLVTMKQMGLNVAGDPLMCVNYIGVKGGMVIYVADDPGPISSQTEQDTRHYAEFAHIPVFDCSSPEEAFILIQKAFDFSENNGTPVIFRSTTRVCHSCAVVDVPEIKGPKEAPGFVKDKRWVIFPGLAFKAKQRLVNDEKKYEEEFTRWPENSLTGKGRKGILCGGISYAYVIDAVKGREEEYSILKIATPYPFPKAKALELMKQTDSITVFEELDPVLEDALHYIDSSFEIHGKRDGSVQTAGELSADAVRKVLDIPGPPRQVSDYPLPVRPPVLCGGCPHRGAFYAVKKAMKGKKAIYCGDIGCYTLGNAMPLDMVDTCLCMGAGITIAQGLNYADKSSTNFAFAGDSTFFASGITGLINAVYNKADMIMVVLDNRTTAMTGHQPHPGIGVTVSGEPTVAQDIEKICGALGVTSVRTADPLKLEESVKTVEDAAKEEGVRIIVFRSPCIALKKDKIPCKIDPEKCVGCQKCIKELGCPALNFRDKKALIDEAQCTGCGLCSALCKKDAIRREGE